MNRPVFERLAICSWSLQPSSPQDLIAKLDTVGIRRIQLGLSRLQQGSVWAEAAAQLTGAGIEIVSGMASTVGEDYTTPDTIRRTGGVVPDATWPQSWANFQQMAPLAQTLGLRLVTMHAGFLPRDASDPTYQKLVERLGTIADLFADHELTLGFETGQEDAATLIAFLDRLGKDNVGVNFDPANMILYDMDDPNRALRRLLDRVVQCHIKDATRSHRPGTWGIENVVGAGQVDWRAFFKILSQGGYEGDLCIERESGSRVDDVIAARDYVVKVTEGR